MFAILHALGMLVADLFKSRSRLEAENLFLRHQLNVALRRAPPRVRLRNSDRVFMAWIVRLWPDLLDWPMSLSPTPFCAGTGLGSGRSGAGSQEIGQGDRRLIMSCAI